MTTYTIRLNWGDTIQFAANLVEASATIYLIADDGERMPTQWQTADARHRPEIAARLVLRSLGSDFWASPDVSRDRSADGEPTYGGLTEDAYIDSLIESVD